MDTSITLPRTGAASNRTACRAAQPSSIAVARAGAVAPLDARAIPSSRSNFSNVNCIRGLTQSRRIVGPCHFLPFGRNIFDSSDDEASTADGLSTSRRGSSRGGVSAEPQQLGSITPYAIFITLFVDRISKDTTHPAFQPAHDGKKTRLGIAASLWAGLQPAEKESFYRAFRPLCSVLNGEMAMGRPVCNLIPRVYGHGSSLPPAQKNELNAVLLSAIERRGAMLLATDTGCPDAGRPHREGEDTQRLQFEHESMRDECDEASIRTALAAAGLSRFITSELNSSDSRSSLYEGAGDEQAMAAAAGSLALGGGMDRLSAMEADVNLVTRIRPQQPQQEFWGDFMGKCRMAWDVFFPKKQVLPPAHAMRARLQMILVSDRSGLDLPTLMKIRNQSLAALAATEGWDSVSELELQVGSQKATGERMTMNLPLSQIPELDQLRDREDYVYEDDDDYEEEPDDTKVGEILERPRPHEIESSGQYSATLPGGEPEAGEMSQALRAAGMNSMLFK